MAHAALAVYDVDELGLDRLDKAVLDALVRRFGGGPVGVGTLAVAVGEEIETVEEVAEPFLVRAGLLARTPRGRVATPGGLAPSRAAAAARRRAGLPTLFDATGDRSTGRAANIGPLTVSWLVILSSALFADASRRNRAAGGDRRPAPAATQDRAPAST